MLRVRFCVAVNSDRADAFLARSAHHAARDFAAIRDQDFAEHGAVCSEGGGRGGAGKLPRVPEKAPREVPWEELSHF